MSTENPEGTPEASAQPNEVDFVSKTEYTKVQQEKERLQRLAAELSESRESLKSQLESFGDFSPEKIKELQNMVHEFKAKDAGGDPEALNEIWAEKEAKIRAEAQAELEKERTTKQQLEAKYHELTVTSKVMDNYGTNVNDDLRGYIKDVVAKHVDVDEHTGAFVVKDDKGEVRYKAHNPGEKMTVEDLFAELETRYPSAFKAKGINKGSLNSQGQPIQGQKPSTFGNVDIDRFKTDAAYRESIPQVERAKLFIKLGL